MKLSAPPLHAPLPHNAMLAQPDTDRVVLLRCGAYPEKRVPATFTPARGWRDEFNGKHLNDPIEWWEKPEKAEWWETGNAPNDTPLPSPPPALPSARRELLMIAADLVDGSRDTAYGKPEDSFSAIADLWNAYLDAVDGDLRPHDVAAMMILLKLARVAGSGGTHHDSWVDAAGYAACGAECAGHQP
jgi:hypothetical protein